MLRISEQFHASDLGRQRQGNEDNYFVRSPLFVVADGMGGAQAGEVASEMAVDSFDGGLPDGAVADALVRIIQDANRRIHDRSRSDEQAAGMGTTCTAAYVGDSEVTVAHVGDSRAYLWRGGELTRLTRDHSLVGELVAAPNEAGGRDNITVILFRLEEVGAAAGDGAAAAATAPHAAADKETGE